MTLLLSLALTLLVVSTPLAQQRPRARDLGVAPGLLPPGRLNAITDVAGVAVGQATVREGDSVRTGVTAVVPHPGNLFQERVPAAIHVGNGFGKLVGATQVAELGELETPILLTCTLCVWKAADAMVAHLLSRAGMEEVRSINPVVGETNDGYALNAIRSRPITERHVRAALESAAGGRGRRGQRGGGHGDGGVRMEGRDRNVVPTGEGRGQHLDGRRAGAEQLRRRPPHSRRAGRPRARRDGLGMAAEAQGARGSIMIVLATDAPISDRNLRRLAARAILGVGRTGSAMDNGSGDYVIAFSTHPAVRRRFREERRSVGELGNDAMSGLFQGAVEATEEAIYNSLFKATTERANGNTVEAIPVDDVVRMLKRSGAVR